MDLLFIFYLFAIKDIKLNVAQMVKNPPAIRETWVRSLGWEDPLEEGLATHPSIHAWRIPWTEEPGGLQSMGSQRVRHDWVTKHSTARKWKSCTRTSKQAWILILFKVPVALRKAGSCSNSVDGTCLSARLCETPTLTRGAPTVGQAGRHGSPVNLGTNSRKDGGHSQVLQEGPGVPPGPHRRPRVNREPRLGHTPLGAVGGGCRASWPEARLVNSNQKCRLPVSLKWVSAKGGTSWEERLWILLLGGRRDCGLWPLAAF